MKKVLVVHNKYQQLGGEDIAVENEIQFLKKHYEVRILYFENEITAYFKQILYFILNQNIGSAKILRATIEEFNPDLVYVHNTWFKASVSIFTINSIHKYFILSIICNFILHFICVPGFLQVLPYLPANELPGFNKFILDTYKNKYFFLV